MIEIVMPKLGLTMTEGTIETWLKQEGDEVAAGEAILEIQTDKSTATVEAPAAGTLSGIRYAEPGTEVEVGTVLACLLEAGECAPAPAPAAAAVQTEPAASGDAEEYDICVIGGGPGGYVAAIRAARQGARTCLVERDALGGTCLNRGCIPTKTLLQTAHFYAACQEMEAFGIHLETAPSVDWGQAVRNKDERVATLVNGVSGLLRRHKVHVIQGEAHFLDSHRIQVGNETVSSRNFILATGSAPDLPPVPGMDLPGIMTSDEALSMERLPESIVILGGGVIGLELGQLYSTLGVKVTIVEMEERLIARFDRDVTDTIEKTLKRQGVEVLTGSKVVEVKAGYTVRIETPSGQVERGCDAVLVVAGRRPESALAQELGLKMNGRAVAVDDDLRTSIPHIFAIGDVTGKGMLAHSASHQGIHAVDAALGLWKGGGKGYIPACIYTAPELASVGMTEEEARAARTNILVGRFPFTASGRALSAGHTEGFVKLIADEKYHELLGVHIVGAGATELIAEATLALELECTAEELMETIHAHPTMSEGMMEAAFQMVGQGIHIP